MSKTKGFNAFGGGKYKCKKVYSLNSQWAVYALFFSTNFKTKMRTN